MSMANDDKLHAAMLAKGHSPVLTSYGDIDVFVLDYENHNGPMCFRCEWSCCQLCLNDETEIPQCTEVETSIEFFEDTRAGYTWFSKDRKYCLALNGTTWNLYGGNLRLVASNEDLDELQKKIGFTLVLKSE